MSLHDVCPLDVTNGDLLLVLVIIVNGDFLLIVVLEVGDLLVMEVLAVNADVDKIVAMIDLEVVETLEIKGSTLVGKRIPF